ncbi:MAG: zeta toxin family protein [Lachnospiraceae bacterium]|nr:zeta toxin family protein [Lachnospiraceae bacterium]
MKRFVVIAGVNGAGKTTFYSTEDVFSDIVKINFDETVRSFGSWHNPSDVKKAGKIVLEKIEECFTNGASFSQETTLCGRSIINNMKRAEKLGYELELYYIGLDCSKTAKDRVDHRVSQGGHGISEEDIERRYHESLKNLKLILPICNMATIYDNSLKLTRISIFRNGKCEWSVRNTPQWYKDLKL